MQIIFLRNTNAQMGECCEGDSNVALKIHAGFLSQVEKWTGSGERGDPSDSLEVDEERFGMVPPGVRNSLGLPAVYDLLRAQFRKVLPLRGASPESDQDREEVDVYG